jgi:hypothetical protein
MDEQLLQALLEQEEAAGAPGQVAANMPDFRIGTDQMLGAPRAGAYLPHQYVQNEQKDRQQTGEMMEKTVDEMQTLWKDNEENIQEGAQKIGTTIANALGPLEVNDDGGSFDTGDWFKTAANAIWAYFTGGFGGGFGK